MSSEPNVLSVPEEARIILDLLLDEIVVDEQTRALKDRVTFTGTPKPFLPLPFKSQACSSAIHGAFGTIANRISQLRFGKPQDISINTDHASLFLNGVFMVSINGYGLLTPEYYKMIPEVNEDPNPNALKTHISSIYQCKDGRYFHLHGSLMAKKTLDVLGIDPELPINDKSQAREIIQKVASNFTAEELQSIMTDAGLCGDICLTPDEYDETEQGKIMNKKPIVEIRSIGPSVPPTPFTMNPSSGKILDGIKVVEFSRVVAGPVIGRCLAELGATIVRVIAPDLPDFKMMQPDFNVDKRPTYINLRTPKGQAQLKHLLQEADVFIQGYRPGRLASFGFGPEALSEIAAKRNKGMVILDESCYGEEGPWASRPGYQQIADVITGVAWETGKASGKNNPIVPCFPISDYGAGVAGAVAVLVGLLRRAEQGGSWFAHTSLTQFNLFQRRQGQYPHEMVRKIYEEGPPLDYDWFMGELVAGIVVHLQKTRPDLNAFFDVIPDTPFGTNFRHIAPVCKWSDHPTRFSTTVPWGYYRPGWSEDDANELESKVAGLEG